MFLNFSLPLSHLFLYAIPLPDNTGIKFNFEPFITINEWDQIQAKIALNKKKAKNEKYPDKFFARGLISCGHCHGRVGTKNGVENKSGETPHYYRCHWAQATPKVLELNRKKKCNMPSHYWPVKTERPEGALLHVI